MSEINTSAWYNRLKPGDAATDGLVLRDSVTLHAVGVMCLAQFTVQ